MIYELTTSEFPVVAHLFEGHKQYVAALAVINHDFPGRVFVDDRSQPQTALVWAVSRWAYIEGDAHNRSFLEESPEFIRETVMPDSKQMKQNWFEIYAANSPQWLATLDACLKEFEAERHFESVFCWDVEEYKEFRSVYTMPSEVTTRLVDLPLLPERAQGVSSVPEEMKSRTSFGIELMVGDRKVSECRSNGFVNGMEFMIDVNTFDNDDRGRGYATAAGVALLDICLEDGQLPIWETTEHNEPSRKLAKRLCFVEEESYPVYAIEF